MSTYNILSIDGGGVFVLMPLLLLRRLERAYPGYLGAVDLFAGTSAGALSAVILAAHDEPAAGLERAIEFWETSPIFALNLGRAARAAAGLSPLFSQQELRGELVKIIGRKTLGDSPHKVLAASMQLDDRSRDRRRSWRPVSISNLEVEGGRYRDIPLVDAALRSAAAPIAWPVYQGHVDGGIFANDPSMLALTRVLRDQWGAAERAAHARDYLDSIRLLSLGEGQTVHHLRTGKGNWGYWRWLANPRLPLALVELAVSSTGEEISEQCRLLLGERQYHRLNPNTASPVSQASHLPRPAELLKSIVRGPSHAVASLREPVHLARVKARQIGDAYPLQETLAWLETAGWPGQPQPA